MPYKHTKKGRQEKKMKAQNEIVKSGANVRITGSGERTSLEVEVGKLPSPTRSYAADAAGIHVGQVDVHLVFVQRVPFTSRVSTAVRVRYSRQNFEMMVERGRDFHRTLRRHCEKSGYGTAEPVIASDFQDASPAEKTLTERASFEKMSFLGGDAEIEFFFVSPGQVQAFQANSTGRTDVVREVLSITMSTPVLERLLSDAEKIGENHGEG